MTRGVGGQSPANVQTYLKGVDYPAKKDDLIQKAQENEAPEEVMEILEQLQEEEYGGPQDVSPLRCSRDLIFLGDAEGLKIGLPHETRGIRGLSALTRVFSRFFDHAPHAAGNVCVVIVGP